MTNNNSSGPMHDTPLHSPGIWSARAQFEAAQLRRARLIMSGRLSDPPTDETLPKKTFPGYTLLRELHRGGQGIVYLALQESTGRQVAVKLLRRWPTTGRGTTELGRFQREVEILSRLKHPNVVTIYDCGREGDDVYLVMEYVKGRPLDDHVKQCRPPLRETLNLFARVCDGVNAAHLRGVLHRDLKPGNILVDEQGEPRLLDFGLAKLVNDSADAAGETAMTMTGQFVGSLPWASPEQAEGRSDQLDIRSDVYSLGVVLYQLLTGRFPYPVAGRMEDVVRHIVHNAPLRASTIEPKWGAGFQRIRRGTGFQPVKCGTGFQPVKCGTGFQPVSSVNRELETILLKCLAKAPERRYQSAGELARDLRHYLAGRPIEARRDSLAYVMSKRLARYRVAVIAAASTLLIVLCALIGALASWRQAELQRGIAQQKTIAAQQSAERADREADQARAVNDFMRDVLSSVEPENQGADVRLIDVLASATVTASQRFADLPQQQAMVRDLLGHIYDKLSRWTEAKAEYGRAAELWRQSAGPDDSRTVFAEFAYASTLANLEQIRELEQVLQHLMPRLERAFGPEHRTAFLARRYEALLHLFHNRLSEAERILLELRAHPDLKADDATQMKLLFGLIAVHNRRLSTEPREQRFKILAQAEPLARECIERSTRSLGPASRFTLKAQASWAALICQQGRYQDAARLCRSILDGSAGNLGACHQVRMVATLALAEALSGLGHESEPAELHLRTIECARQQHDRRSPVFLGQIAEALPYLDRARRPAEGEALARELTAVLQEFGGGHHDIAFGAELYVARFVSMLGRLDQAEPMFQSLLTYEDQIEDRCARGRLHMFYGSHLTRRGCLEEAERELENAVTWIGDIRRGTCDSQPDDVILAYIELYQASGQHARVAEYEALREEVAAQVATPIPPPQDEAEHL